MWVALACSGEDRPSGRPAIRPSASDSRPVVLFFGTSLTAGLGLEPEQAYPALIQQKIDSAGLPFRAVNAGVSGETSVAGLRRIDWLLSQPVAVLVLELGANDALRGQDLTAARRNLQEIIDRTFINTWEDKPTVDAVKATGRKQLIIAGLWTEICVAMPAIQAAVEGWDVTVITDASGGTSVEAHEVGIQRMIAAGVNMMTWMALASEWQRDWARTEHLAGILDVMRLHGGGSSIA
ncbi:MAG: isochorismatase family protein, partial [Gemmatimonadales bacterium]|nr:isochorismatase family protein [Gemmatimonadales bacterium]